MKLKHLFLSVLLTSGIMLNVSAQINQTNVVPTVEESKIFLEKNKKAKGIVVTPSGLQYKIIKKGNGEKPLSTDKVSINFTFSYVNGKVFNEDFKTNAWQHHLDKGLLGMIEAIPMMPIGSKWVLYLPTDLAFGQNAFDNVPMGSAIICEVELLGVVK